MREDVEVPVLDSCQSCGDDDCTLLLMCPECNCWVCEECMPGGPWCKCVGCIDAEEESKERGVKG